MKMMESDFYKEGDLVRIPQSCLLFDPDNIEAPNRFMITDKPYVAIFIKSINNSEDTAKIWLDGQFWATTVKNIFIQKKET